MKDTIRFDIIYGKCAKCGGPLFFTQTIDWEGARVNSLQCWNGHYESIEVSNFQFMDERSLTREQIESILPFIGFVRVDERPGG
ncbi:MAG: hypothetical protein HZB29_01825 [Nitrospinae bacterium]|nr:hypothetical protein [Nitrospinota bacterium]